jgi:leader peptidase (prepilin peptidase) / N-methyltransferase
MTAFAIIVCAVLGLAVGSFCNVVIWRVPRRESVVVPASHCPACDRPISPRDNVPLLGWLALGGRCRHCDARISWRYPFVELVTAVLFAAVGARFHDSWALPAYLVLTGGLVALSAIDLDHHLLPNRVLYPVGMLGGALLLVASAIEHDWATFGRALLGAAIAFSFFFALHVAVPRGMGFGDVRLSFLLGLFLGWLGWFEVLGGFFAGFFYGAVVGIALMAAGVATRKQRVPFGPFLAAGAMTFVLFGAQLHDWYRSLSR